MATEITSAEASLIVTLGLTLGNKDYGFTHTSDTSVNTEAWSITESIDYASEKLILDNRNLTDDSGDLDFRHLVIANRDGLNFVRVRLENDDNAFDMKLPADSVMVIPSVSFATDTTAAVFSAYGSLRSLSLQADTSSVDVEVTAFR